MKLKFGNKLLLWLGGLLTLLIGAGLITLAVSNVVMYQVETVLGCQADGRWVALVLLVSGIVAVLFSLYALSIPGKLRYKRRNFVIQNTEIGDLRISVKAIEGLVKRCIDMHDEINLSSMHIISRKTGVVVELRISLTSNISIPLAVASLQKQIKQYLVASSGIEVNHVSVTVDTTKGGEVKKCAPYVPAEEPAVQHVQEASEAKKEKKPMHQRLFASKNEQENPAQPVPAAESVKAEEKAEAPQADAAPVPEAVETAAAEPAVESAPVAENAPAETEQKQEEATHE